MKKEKTFDEKWDKGVMITCAGLSIFMGGYLTGRFTAVSDLQKGYLDCFVPKYFKK